jgi:hypothetical protein
VETAIEFVQLVMAKALLEQALSHLQKEQKKQEVCVQHAKEKESYLAVLAEVAAGSIVE